MLKHDLTITDFRSHKPILVNDMEQSRERLCSLEELTVGTMVFVSPEVNKAVRPPGPVG